jgi:flagellar basal body-associated protein FliL
MRIWFVTALALVLLGASARAEDARKGPRHKITQSPSYVEIDPLYATILDVDRPVGMLLIGIGLDIPDARLRSQAENAMPVLRDAFVRNLMSYGSTSVRIWKQPDVTEIAARLQRVTDRALGRKGARLLLAQVAMRLTK